MRIGITWRGEGPAYLREVTRRVLIPDPSPWAGDPTVWIVDDSHPHPGRKLRLSKILGMHNRLREIVSQHLCVMLGVPLSRKQRKEMGEYELLREAYTQLAHALTAANKDDPDAVRHFVEQAHASLDVWLQEPREDIDEDDAEENDDDDGF